MKKMINRFTNSIKARISILTGLLLLLSVGGYSQIENVLVEKYYISDSIDATDTSLGRVLENGSVTYRIYLDLKAGSKLRSIYGDQYHPIQVKSTQPFYNNIFQSGATFGYQLNRNLYLSTPTLGLDSWITLGLAAKNQSGVLKIQDTDGNFFAGANNGGGSSSVSGGLLNNTDPIAGVPLTTSDGMMTNTAISGTWIDNGFKDGSGADTTVFGAVNSGNEFFSYNSILQQSNSVIGGAPDSTIVLVAQLTTKGEISFKLNIELEQFDGANVSFVKYVSTSDTLLPGEVVSPLLAYPLACGCTNSDYFEYDPVYSCLEVDSCKTKIRFGCTDIVACNYDPEANFNVPELCCYPGLCQDRDLAIVCPDLNYKRSGFVSGIYPNPANSQLSISVRPGSGVYLEYSIFNLFGEEVLHHTTGSVTGDNYTDLLDISALPTGVYILKSNTGNKIEFRKFAIEK